VKLVLFCEAAADFRTASALVDRVLGEHGPDWVRALVPSDPQVMLGVREWLSDGEGREYFDLHRIDDYKRSLQNVRFPHGHFDGKPGAAGALMARNAFFLVRERAKRDPAREVDAVVLVWDMDAQPVERRAGLKQAREAALPWAPFAIVLGCPDRMREAWVLAGFEPESKEEHARLEELRKELGFSPCHEGHRLSGLDEDRRRQPKNVVDRLTDEDFEREERCWREAPLDRLRERGAYNGLGTFLDEVKDRLVPLFEPTPRKTVLEHLLDDSL
jgi:hypothetical protein